ncbi:hypothetical protein QQ045_012576 [Rhodiola kirilowii]
MAIRAHSLTLKSLPILQQRLIISRPKTRRIYCRNSINDADLSLQFAVQVVKIKLKKKQREEAIVKSRKILFAEMTEYLGFSEDEMKTRWKLMEEIDKWVVVEGFLSEWGDNFHPLSAKSVKQMVEEHLDFENSVPEPEQSSTSPSSIFQGLKKMIGME